MLRAEALQSNNGRLWANLGAAYGAVQRFDKAVYAYQRALALNHRDAGVLNNLGLALQGLERRQEALDILRDALALDPTNDPALYNSPAPRWRRKFAGGGGGVSAVAGQTVARYANGRVAEVSNELARAVADQGRIEEALRYCAPLLRSTPISFRSAGTKHYYCCNWGGSRRVGQPIRHAGTCRATTGRIPIIASLDLHRVAGQRVLVKGEQGRGDVIQFLRYIKPLAARGARIMLSVYQRPGPAGAGDAGCANGGLDRKTMRPTMTG